MIGFYDYTVILTYLGFLSGVFGILQAMNGNLLLLTEASCELPFR